MLDRLQATLNLTDHTFDSKYIIHMYSWNPVNDITDGLANSGCKYYCVHYYTRLFYRPTKVSIIAKWSCIQCGWKAGLELLNNYM